MLFTKTKLMSRNRDKFYMLFEKKNTIKKWEEQFLNKKNIN